MYQEGLQHRKTAMIAIYKIIYLIIFRYGIFFLIIAGTIYGSKLIIEHQTSILTISNNDINEKGITIKQFKKQIDSITNTGDLTIFVGLGDLRRDKNILSSHNNLAKYKGYILPRYFSADISIFNITGYSKEHMESFFDKFFAVKNITNTIELNKQIIEIPNTIKETFNLQCLFQTKIYNGLCDTFTNNFVNTFLLYNISKDIAGFNEIFSNLASRSSLYRESICNDLIYHSYYANIASDELKNTMKLCGTKKVDIFNKFALFSQIQKELETKTISKIIYKDNIATAYKINSFIQILYEDINNRRININRLNNYFDVLEELLKTNSLDTTEKNIIYYFNNYKVKNSLENPELEMKIANKGEISNLLKRINTINNGNILIGYKGLKDSIDEGLLVGENTEGNNEEINNTKEDIAPLLEQIKNLSIKESIISGKQALIEGSLLLKDGSKNAPISIDIKVFIEIQSRVLFVKKIEIINKADITENINNLLDGKQRSWGDMQSYLNNNMSLFASDDSQSDDKNIFCQKAKTELEDIAIVALCNENTIIIQKNINNIEKKIGINYENYIFEGISVSDEESKEIINEYLNQPSVIARYTSIDGQNMISFIKELLNVLSGEGIEDDEDDKEFIGGENTIIIIEKIERYLKTKVTDIIEEKSNANATFEIGGINFLGSYNIENHTIEKLYFKFSKDNIVLISNIYLILDDDHNTEIKQFIKNPLDYIKTKSPQSYIFYMQNENKK